MATVSRLEASPVREADNAFLALLDIMSEGASLSSADGTIVYANPAEERLFGYPSGGLLGLNVRDQNAYRPEENDRIVAAVMRELAKSGRWTGEWVNKRKDGSLFITSAEIRPVLWRGEPHWLCVQRDVASDRASFTPDGVRLSLAVEAADLGIWEWDLLRNSFVYSARARAICGFPLHGEITYEDVRGVTHPDDLPTTRAIAARALDPAIRERQPYEYRIIRRDGAQRWVRAHGYAIFGDIDGETRALRYIGTLEDITERTLTQAEAKNTARQMRIALEAAQMAVWSLDLTSGTLSSSAEFNRLLAFPDGAEPSIVDIEACYAPGERERVQAEWQACLDERRPRHTAEFNIDRRDGVRRRLMVVCEVSYADDGAPLRALGVIIDVTEHRLAAERLRESEQRFRQAADCAPAPIWMTNQNGDVEFANQAMAELSGLPRERLLGDVWLSLLHPEDLPAVHERRQKAWADNHAPYAFEARFRGADGSWRRLDVRSCPRRDSDGRFLGYVGLAIDRTEEKAALASLKESEARFRTLADRVPIMIWMSDPAGACVYLNAALRAFWGVDADAVDRFDWRTTMHPDDAPRIVEAVRQALTNTAPLEIEGRYLCVDGRYRTALTRAEPRFSETGEFLGMIGVNVDLSEIREAEAALRESEERQRIATAAAGLGVFEWFVREDRAIWENDRMYEIFGRTREDGTISYAALMADYLHPDDKQNFAAALAQSMQERVNFQGVCRIIRKSDRKTRWLEFAAKFELGPDGAPHRLAGVVADITERKEDEQHRSLLLHELNHRVKNTLAVVQSIARQSFADQSAQSREAFEGRLVALASAHALLSRENWGSVTLHEVVATAAQACGVDMGRLSVQGSRALLQPKQAVAFAMAIHELATNAIKHGALSNEAGVVSAEWSLRDNGSALTFTWTERGGPSVTPPRTRGFGSLMIERALARDLQGEASLSFEPEGLVCTIAAPLAGEG